MNNLSKLLYAVKNDAAIFRNEDVNFILGLTSSVIKKLKKNAIELKLIEQKTKEFYLTNKGKDYLKQHPLEKWRTKNFPKRPEINLEYLKLEKMPPIVTKALRNLAKHLLQGEELKFNSIESYFIRELLSDNSTCQELKNEIETYILQDKIIKLDEFFNIFLSFGLTKSIISILFLDIISKNKNIIAVYEKGMFQLKLDYLLFDRMIFAPQNFEIRKTVIDGCNILADLSEIILPLRTNNILDITKGLIYFIRRLDKYTLQTERLTKNTFRFRNIVINAKDPVKLFERDIPNVLINKSLFQADKHLLNAFQTSIDELQNASTELLNEIKIFTLNIFKAKSREELTKRFDALKDFAAENELKVLINNINDIESDDYLWISRIATFINKYRVPRDWTDYDIADYKLKIKELSLKVEAIESIIDGLKCPISDSFNKLLDDIEKLSIPEKNILLKKIING